MPPQRAYIRRGVPMFGAVGRVIAPLAFLLLLLVTAPSCRAEDPSLPDAPQPQAGRSPASTGQSPQLTGPGRDNMVFGVHVGPAYPIRPDDKWDTIVNAGQHPETLSATDTLIYAAHEQVLPTALIPALVAAGWGQLLDLNPRVGIDAGGFGERIGYALLRQATDRLTGDGVFAAAFRQDPRFYRETNGPLVHRGLRAVRQTFIRRNSNGGGERVNASGILGHALGSYLAMTYYPDISSGAGVATKGFATALTGDMESKLFVEFMPDLLRLAFRRNR
ncbi:MAG: hypothetical protein ACJ71S_03255 [Acidobacteriaceae bacterium]